MSRSKVLSPAVLKTLSSGDETQLFELDKHGILPAPGEDIREFAARLTKLSEALDELESNLKKHKNFEVAPGIKISSGATIPGSVAKEALDQTWQLYKVRPDWVPGFFANESFGLLWGGCSLSDPASGLVLFIIRKVFKGKRHWLFYDRRELLAHELTHAAHQSFDQWQFEEYFAYRTAVSPMRRFFGGCFICKYDAAGFLLPILLLPVIQLLNLLNIAALPMWPFWIAAAIYPLFLLLRTSWLARTVQRARNFLHQQGVMEVEAVLFRMTVEEIRSLARRKMPQGQDLRWKVLSEYMKTEVNNENF